MLLSVGITELLHAFAVVVWLFQVLHFANQINQTHSISGTALSSIGIYAINKQWKASSNSVTIWPTSFNWSNFVFNSKIIQCILKKHDFKAGAVQIRVEFLAKVLVFFFKILNFHHSLASNFIRSPAHSELKILLGQMAPPTPLPGHSAWWRLSGFWCRHLGYFEMVFGSARSWSFSMSWAARSSNLLSPSSFKDLLLMLFNQKEGTFTKYTTMWRSHVIYQKTHPNMMETGPRCRRTWKLWTRSFAIPKPCSYFPAIQAGTNLSNRDRHEDSPKVTRFFEMCFGACFANKLVKARGVLLFELYILD